MASLSAAARWFVNKTPLIRSPGLSEACGTNVWLKLECLQPSGSFKDRGISHLCKSLADQNGANREDQRFVSSSYGNAGYSVSCVGRTLGVPVTVVVPSTTKPVMIEKMKKQKAEVIVHGDGWNEADAKARELCAADLSGAAHYVHPYEHPLLWEGHSFLIDEILEDGVTPGAVVACVGGGGLLSGIYQGLQRHSLTEVRVVATETEGAASFAKAFTAGQTVRLDTIDSIAMSLGALQVADEVLRLAKMHPTTVQTMADEDSVSACLQFAEDHRILVEPACGTALAVAYLDKFRASIRNHQDVVIVVCGGGGVNIDLLHQWKSEFKL